MATQSKRPQAQKRKAKTAPRKTTPIKTSSQSNKVIDRHQLIEEAAYFIAERRGFQGDMVLDDWLQAEREVDTLSAS